MQFIGQFQIDPDLCDSLIQLHKIADKHGLVVRGRLGGEGGEIVIDVDRKDSYDLGVSTIPDDMAQKYKIPEYFLALKSCVEQYIKQHQILECLGPFRILETPIIQHYKPGGGFKFKHFERTGIETAARMMTFMTYLNDVTDGGGTTFTYQDVTVNAEKGKTLLWPPDFTHTHVGQVSPTEDKYIITGWLSFYG